MVDQNLPTGGRFVTDAHVSIFKDRIAQIIADLGRNVTYVLTPQVLDCPNCGFDYMAGRSNNIYTSNASGVSLNKDFPPGQKCPVCQGIGKLQFPRSVVQKSLIGFAPPPEEFSYEVYGLKPEDVARTKNAIAIKQDIELAQYAIIDGAEYEKITFPRKTGLRDLGFLLTYWKKRHS
jgi:hypothetical protein